MKVLERCPECDLVLSPIVLAAGTAATCRSCAGVCVNLDVLREHAPDSVVQELWTAAHDRGREAARPCPACEKPMRTFDVQATDARLELDACTTCRLVWFDGKELEHAGVKLTPPAPREASRAAKTQQTNAADLARLLVADVWQVRRLRPP